MVRFSIVIPVAPYRNAEILKSLENIDYNKKDYEIIVEKGTNVSINRNRGIDKSKGEIILLLDDDGYVSKDLLRNADKFFNKYKEISIVGGPQLTPRNDKWFARISGYAISSFFGTQNMSKRYKKGKLDFDGENIITSAICFVKKYVFDKIRFNSELFPGEDPEFFYKAKKRGFKIAYTPNLFIYHKRRDNLKGFLKQFYLYGKMRLKTGYVDLLFFMPTLFILYLISLPSLVLISRIFLIPFLIYIISSIAFSFYESIRNKSLISFILLPFFYACIHISYGVGFLVGIVNKLIDN